MNVIQLCLFVLVLTFFSFSVQALPAITLSTGINQNTFYTMPLVPATTLDFSYDTSDIVGPLQTQAQVDVIIGTTTERWWDVGYQYRRKITSTFTPVANKTLDIIVNTQQLISSGSMRSDCLDLRLVLNHSIQLPYIIEDCNSATTKVSVKSSDDEFYNLWLYYGESSPGALGVPVTEYKFYDTFSDLSNWNVGVGSVSISSGKLHSGAGDTSVNLTSAQISRNSKYQFSFTLDAGANMTSYLANPTNISLANLAITFQSASNEVDVCLNQGGTGTCSTYTYTIGTATHEVVIDIAADGTTNIYIDDVLLNAYPHFTPSVTSLLAYDFEGVGNLDDLSLLEYFSGSSTFTFGAEQEHYRRYAGNAVGGIYGFNMPTQGIASNHFSIVTVATRAGYDESTSVLYFDTKYERLHFSIEEQGIVDTLDERYIVNVEGDLTITNDNDVPIDLLLNINSPLTIEETGGSRITNDRITTTLGASSSVTIPYLATGIITINPIASANGVMATVLQQNFVSAYHDFGTVVFDKKNILFAEPDKTEAVVEDHKKTFNYQVNGTFVFDKYSLLIINKKISQSIVEKDDIVTVGIKINNFDPFSRFVDVVDVIPSDFVLYANDKEMHGVNTINWSFKMNKETSRDVSYDMKYIGNSTGHIIMPKVNVTSGRLRQFSNEVSIVRKQKESNKLFITKTIESWNGEGYKEFKNVVRVTLSVVNPTQEPFHNLFLDDMPNADGVLFTAVSMPTFYTGRWNIDTLVPGQVWSTSYITNAHKFLLSQPTISSFLEDVNYESVVIEKKSVAVNLYDVKYSPFSTGFAAILIIIMDVGIVGLYLFKNPLYGDDGELMTLKRFIKKTNDWYVRKKVERAKQKIFKQIEHEQDMSKIHLKELKKQSGLLLSFFRLRSLKYYKDRNMSIFGDAILNFFGNIWQWMKSVASVSGGDWGKTILYLSKFTFLYVVIIPIRWFKNASTYSLFLAGTFLLDKNENSKLGRIFSFSAKVLNPHLKEFVYNRVDKKAAQKQEMYRREMRAIFKDKFKKFKKHGAVQKEDTYLPFSEKIKNFLKNPFKKN